MKNKIAPVALTIFLLLGAFSGSALAGHSKVFAKATVCTVRTCTSKKTHTHGGKTYFAHHKNDGHAYHTNKHH